MKTRMTAILALSLLLAAPQAVPERNKGAADPTMSAAPESAGANIRNSVKQNGQKKKIKLPPKKQNRVAVMFIGHGEPATAEDGDIPITFPDGSPFGPHAVELGVPADQQYTEWAAAYEEIATAMAYIFGDINGNGIEHEVALVPDGDVPGFFNWPAFHAEHL